MPEPTDKNLYNRVKKQIYSKIKENSAYRSGLIVKKYKELGGTYSGKKTNEGLTRWFKEKWVTNEGKTTYQSENDVFRPTKRISSKTPTTFGELSKTQVEKAQKEKKETGRVKLFKTK
jgi:hypothetical protein